MPYFMVANYGGVSRDAGPLIMEAGAEQINISLGMKMRKKQKGNIYI